MIDPYVRRFLPRFTGPLIALYQRLGLHPNHLTVFGFLVALSAAAFASTGARWAALSLWWMSRVFDGTDGILARATQRVSAFGGFLDITLDMAAYSAMIVAFALWQPGLAIYWLLILFLYVLAITTALSLGALERERGLDRDNRSLALAAGLAEAGETGIVYTLILMFPGHTRTLALVWIAALTLTVVARCRLARVLLEQTPR